MDFWCVIVVEEKREREGGGISPACRCSLQTRHRDYEYYEYYNVRKAKKKCGCWDGWDKRRGEMGPLIFNLSWPGLPPPFFFLTFDFHHWLQNLITHNTQTHTHTHTYTRAHIHTHSLAIFNPQKPWGRGDWIFRLAINVVGGEKKIIITRKGGGGKGKGA